MLHLPPTPLLRKGVFTYLLSCEDFMAFAAATDHVPFSAEEQEVIEYYTAEVTKTLVPLGQ